MNTRAFGWLIGVALLVTPLSAQTILAGFDTSAQGWSVVSFGSLSANDYSIVGTYGVSYSGSGGHPGGYIFTNDPDDGNFAFGAPASVRAQLTGANGSVLSYALSHSGTVDSQGVDMIIEGGGLRLLWQSGTPLNPSDWITVSATLAPSAQWHVGSTNGALASTADFQTVLGNVSGLYFRGEFTTGAEMAGLDTVAIISSVPEPTGFAFLAGALALMACRWQRSRAGV